MGGSRRTATARRASRPRHFWRGARTGWASRWSRRGCACAPGITGRSSSWRAVHRLRAAAAAPAHAARLPPGDDDQLAAAARQRASRGRPLSRTGWGASERCRGLRRSSRTWRAPEVRITGLCLALPNADLRDPTATRWRLERSSRAAARCSTRAAAPAQPPGDRRRRWTCPARTTHGPPGLMLYGASGAAVAGLPTEARQSWVTGSRISSTCRRNSHLLRPPWTPAAKRDRPRSRSDTRTATAAA